jgi:hypothetical protein
MLMSSFLTSGSSAHGADRQVSICRAHCMHRFIADG